MERLLSVLLEEKGSRIISIAPEASVEEAAKMMSEERIGALLVMRGDSLMGILTERDVLNRVVAQGLNAADVDVHTVMTKDVVVISSGRTVRQAMQIVTDKKLRHLPVVHDSELVGMLSGGDLTRSIVEEEEGVIDTLYEYIRGSYPA